MTDTHLSDTNYYGIIRPGEFIRTLSGGAQSYKLDNDKMHGTQSKIKGGNICLAIATGKFKRARSTRETAKAIKAIVNGQDETLNEMRFVLTFYKNDLVWFHDNDLIRVPNLTVLT